MLNDTPITRLLSLVSLGFHDGASPLALSVTSHDGLEPPTHPEINAHQIISQGRSSLLWQCMSDPSRSTCSSTMEANSQRLKEPNGVLSSLNAAIATLDLARDKSSVKQAKDVIGSASILLTTIRVCFFQVHVGRLLTVALRIRRSKK